MQEKDKEQEKKQGQDQEQEKDMQSQENNQNQDQNQSKSQNEYLVQGGEGDSKGNKNFNKIVSIGFFGGIFWSSVLLVLSYFDFTQIGPNFVLERIKLGKWANGYVENLLSIVGIGIISIIIAFIFYFIGRKFNGVLPGIFFGLLLWVIVFILLGKIAFDLKAIKDYSSDTTVTTICLFILYGTFIAYSVSFAFQEQKAYLRGYSK
ncbi:YqhR family membrane protein [Gottfriedia acidiceleris]|uniref:YqhR family membrane protein n=1 Tax=Gottfriedia acidiceleris TaxID=371036 RepID=A0ABY4JPE0_9BACI|nr:YqhR family membrane protein [Gottfriedia acidiceleris]UPM55714.1 YqhR family membrane protein [Gottfriedia acidiceleris]